jgi:two-component system OmpR family response regulator
MNRGVPASSLAVAGSAQPVGDMDGEDLRILVVEDEEKMRALLHRGLRERAFAVDLAADGAEALWRATEFSYDAMLLDVMLPDMDGFAVCRQLRANNNWLPVLMLTALDGVDDRVRGLDGGADDYLVKPFFFAELEARLRALLRRGASPRPVTLQVGDLKLDPASHEVHRGGNLLDLTSTEFALLEFLMRYPNQAHSRTRIVEHVWDEAFDGDLHIVNVYVAYLRDKIDRPFDCNSIETVRGVGYRLRGELTGATAD